VTQAKLRALAAGLPDSDPETDAEVERRHGTEDLSLASAPLPRVPDSRAARPRQNLSNTFRSRFSDILCPFVARYMARASSQEDSFAAVIAWN